MLEWFKDKANQLLLMQLMIGAFFLWLTIPMSMAQTDVNLGPVATVCFDDGLCRGANHPLLSNYNWKNPNQPERMFQISCERGPTVLAEDFMLLNDNVILYRYATNHLKWIINDTCRIHAVAVP